MLTIILVESALEPVPQEICNHIAVRNHAKRRGKPFNFTILDRSIHHSAMKNLKEKSKRGRPDIVHFNLLEALGSPLNKENLLRIYIHTYNGNIISVNPETRLPKNYSRFLGLLEQIFEYKRVPVNSKPLLVLEDKTLNDLMNIVKPSYTIAFSRTGKSMTIKEIMAKFSKEKNLTILIGGFPKGEFTAKTASLADETISVDFESLESWILTSRLIYEYECNISIPNKRIKSMISNE